MIVAFGSGRSRLVGLSEAALFKSIDVARIVAFGSNVCGAISKPPSNVQNFCPSSGNVRLHLGQLFIQTDLLNGNQFDLRHLISSRSCEFLGSAIVSRVQFERSLIRTNGFVFLVGLEISVAYTFKPKDSGKLFFLAGGGHC